MKALPGRESRTSVTEPASLTRAEIGDDQRQRILRATADLAAKRGYNNVPVELIVKRARVSFKTFYSHFRGKEEAFLELFDQQTAETERRIGERLAAVPDAPWAQQVVLAVAALFDSVVEDPMMARACIVEAPAVGPAITDRYQQAMRAMSPLLRRGRDEVADDADLPETLEDTLAGSVLWSAYQRLISGEVDRIESLLPETTLFLLRSYIGEERAREWAEWSTDQTREAPENGVSGAVPRDR